MRIFYRKSFYFWAGLILIISLNTGIYSQENQPGNQETEVKTLISQLYQNTWVGAGNYSTPTFWEFGFTEPMTEILEIGSPAQDYLLEEINNPSIKDQIIILLGGVGDEKSVEPIIEAMISKKDIRKISNAKKINLSANLALTNITVANVIWHHGGGIMITRCPDNPKECWEDWWKKNKSNFSVKTITQSRRYSNYPGYGIYKGKD